MALQFLYELLLQNVSDLELELSGSLKVKSNGEGGRPYIS